MFLFFLAIPIAVLVTLAIAIRNAYQLNWLKPILCLARALAVSFLALS